MLGLGYNEFIVIRVCKSGYPLSGYPDISVNFMAAKNPDILVANPDIRYPDIRIYPLILFYGSQIPNFGVLIVHVSLCSTTSHI